VNRGRLTAELERLGYEEFLPGQERIIRDILAGRDVLAVLPTGAGKSLVYQLSSQLLEGLTVVVSPLIALMKDQVDAMQSRGIAASVLASTESSAEMREQLQQVDRGESKLLYLTPERVENDEFMAQASSWKVSLLVVDEAHCISQWGHDFRPAYLELRDARRAFGRPRTLALTATATPFVRKDVIETLELRQPDLVVHGTDRPNLFFGVRRVDDEGQDRQELEELLGEDGIRGGAGIIYVATTKAAEETADWLRECGIAADFYHGQRKARDREAAQDAFMSGDIQVIAATNAFGMGIDKPDLRFVIHRDIPASVEAYYQEAGRAGRDGQPAFCWLIYRPGDLGRAAFLNGSSGAGEEYERSRREMMRGYAELHDCRRRYLLNYFGEEYEGLTCDACDNCLSGESSDAEKLPDDDFEINDEVVHARWGKGLVQRVTPDSLTVLFEEAGYKVLARDIVESQGLLRRA